MDAVRGEKQILFLFLKDEIKYNTILTFKNSQAKLTSALITFENLKRIKTDRSQFLYLCKKAFKYWVKNNLL